MIFVGSRYDGASIVSVLGSDGMYHPTVFRTIPSGTIQYNTYVVTEGTSFSDLAFKFYQDPSLWWRIADANPEVFYPDSITPGSVIRVPLPNGDQQ